MMKLKAALKRWHQRALDRKYANTVEPLPVGGGAEMDLLDISVVATAIVCCAYLFMFAIMKGWIVL